MITDQRQTGVPNGNAFKTQGINQRTQLVKPNQVGNIGRSMPQNQNLAPALSQAQSQVPQFNPVQPQLNGTSPTQSQAATPDTIANPIGMRDFRTNSTSPSQLGTDALPSSPWNVAMNTDTSINPATDIAASNRYAYDNPLRAGIADAATDSADTTVSTLGIDTARNAIRQLSNRDILTLLDELGSGTLKGGQY